ncbi:MAG: T9SS type A sorting domain-containing protein [Melioribacteraceae bacterium]|nr:T9SS type A sorting domain-containing protein [Melioribacteraceae bacterium]
MKGLQTIFLHVFIYSISVFGQGGWQWISPYPTQNPIRSSNVIGSSLYFWGDMETVLSTHDAGNTFNISARYVDVDNSGYGSNSWQRIAFSDSLTGIVLGKGVHRTTDGGKSWEEIRSSSYFFNVAAFANSKVGWIFGGTGSEKTLDGGKTWGIIWDTLTESHRTYSRIFPLDVNHVWLLRTYHYDQQGDILYSYDGCKSWSKVDVPIQVDSTVEISYYDIKMTVSGLGVAIGSIYFKNERERNSFILKTRDFGKNWVKVEVKKINLNHIIKLTEENWQIYGNMKDENYSRKIVQLTSNDSAKTWHIKNNAFLINNNYHYLYTINYLPKQKVILAATNGGVFKSDNLGVTFYKLTNETDIPIIDFAIDKSDKSLNQIAVAISEDNRYLISEDGGKNWKLSLFPDGIGNKIREVDIVDGVVFINVDGQMIYSSVDGGLTWHRLLSNNSYAFRNLTAFNKNIIAFTGYNNARKIFYSTDGGESWESSPFSHKISFNSLQIINESTIIGCGRFNDSHSSRGMIYLSSDYGKNWRVIDFEREIQNITMVNNKRGFAHSRYKLYRTEDAGLTWNIDLTSNDFYRNYSNFTFYDSLNGLMRVGYYFKETKNGGKSWKNTNKNLPIWGRLKKMEYNNHGDLLILGDDGGFVIKQSDLNIPKNNLSKTTNISSTTLEQNYPNPFNPSTLIKYTLLKQTYVTLTIYSILGEKIVTLVNEVQQPGYHEALFNSNSLSSGMYLYVLKTKSKVLSKKMLLVR